MKRAEGGKVGWWEHRRSDRRGTMAHGPESMDHAPSDRPDLPACSPHDRPTSAPNSMPFRPLLPSSKHPCSAIELPTPELAGNPLARQHLLTATALDTKFGVSIFSRRRCRAQLRVHGTR